MPLLHMIVSRRACIMRLHPGSYRPQPVAAETRCGDAPVGLDTVAPTSHLATTI